LTIALGKEIPKTNNNQVFAEGLGHNPRQRISQKKIENRSLPRAMVKALDKEFSRKNKKKDFAEGLHGSPRQRNYLNKYLKILCRGPAWGPSAKKLPK